MTLDGISHTGRRDLPRLTSLRWFAALAVFLFHMGAAMPWRPLHAFGFGQSGVSFFFMLSGFVLTWSATDLPARAFYQHRLARVYPSHLLTLVVVATLVAAGLRVGHSDLSGVISGSLLVQAWWPGTFPAYAENGVSWSLSVEIFFYALFPLLLPRLRSLRLQPLAIGAVLLGGCVLTYAMAEAGHGEVAYHVPLFRLPEFVAGMLLALVVKRGWTPRLAVSAAAALVAVAGLLSRRSPAFPMVDYLMILPYLAAIAASVGADLRLRPGMLAHPLLVYLGRVSFAFYLVHQVTISLILKGAGDPRDPSTLRGGALLAVCLTCSLLAAMALHHLVELPAQSRLRPARLRTG